MNANNRYYIIDFKSKISLNHYLKTGHINIDGIIHISDEFEYFKFIFERNNTNRFKTIKSFTYAKKYPEFPGRVYHINESYVDKEYDN